MARLLVLLLAVAIVLVKADPAPWQASSEEKDDDSVYGGVHGKYKFYGRYDPCSCSVFGNTYKAVDGCKSFTQEAKGIAPTKQDCPDGLLFNTHLCVCDWPFRTHCSRKCC